MDAAPTTPNASGDPSTERAAADAPFLGTPYIIDMQRPYEYPFPSPATESCPSLLLPYSHGHPSTGIGHAQQHPNAPYPQPLQLTHPFPPSYTSTSSSGSTSTASSITSSTPPSASSTLVHRTYNTDMHAVPNGGYSYSHHNNHRDGSAIPYPSTSGVHPPISFRPTTLLRRRSSSHETHHNLNGLSPVSSLSQTSVPIPPRLLGRDLSLGGGVGNGNGRWRKGRRSGSDGDGSSSVK